MRTSRIAALLTLAALCCAPLYANTAGKCITNPTTACLHNNRFQITATFIDPNAKPPTVQSGQVVALTEDTVYVWFFAADNLEVFIKVLDGCALNSEYWVFAAGLTNVENTITVKDTLAGSSATYHAIQGPAFIPVQDTSALHTCP